MIFHQYCKHGFDYIVVGIIVLLAIPSFAKNEPLALRYGQIVSLITDSVKGNQVEAWRPVTRTLGADEIFVRLAKQTGLEGNHLVILQQKAAKDKPIQRMAALPGTLRTNAYVVGGSESMLGTTPSLLVAIVDASSKRTVTLHLYNGGLEDKTFKAKSHITIDGAGVINKVLWGSNGRLYLTGRDDAVAFAACIQDGKVKWRNNFTWKATTSVNAAVVYHDHIYLVVQSGNYGKFGEGPASTHILAVDPSGKIIGDMVIGGRNGSIAINGEMLGVLVNEATFPNVTVRLYILDNQLDEVRSTVVLGATMGSGIPRIFAYHKGFVWAADTISGITIGKTDIIGHAEWQLTTGTIGRVDNLELEGILGRGDNVMIWGKYIYERHTATQLPPRVRAKILPFTGMFALVVREYEARLNEQTR